MNKIGACFKLGNCLGALAFIPLCTLYAAVCVWLITNSVQLPIKNHSLSLIYTCVRQTNEQSFQTIDISTKLNLNAKIQLSLVTAHNSNGFSNCIWFCTFVSVYLNRLNPKDKNTVKRRIHSVAHCGSITEKLSKWKLHFISILFTCCWCFITTLWASIHPWRVCDKWFSSYSSKCRIIIQNGEKHIKSASGLVQTIQPQSICVWCMCMCGEKRLEYIRKAYLFVNDLFEFHKMRKFKGPRNLLQF